MILIPFLLIISLGLFYQVSYADDIITFDLITDEQITSQTTFKINPWPTTLSYGEYFTLTGTGTPGLELRITLSNHDLRIQVWETTTIIDSDGIWKLDEQFLIPLDFPLGRYQAGIYNQQSGKFIYFNIISNDPPLTILLKENNINNFNQQIQKWNEQLIQTESNIEQTTILWRDAINTNHIIKIEMYTQNLGQLLALELVYQNLIEILQQQLQLYS